MADFRVNVTADTQDAERKLSAVDKAASEAAKPRQISLEIPNYSQLSKNFKDLNKDIENAANSVKQFYRITSQLPVGPIKDINEMAGQLKRVASTASEASRGVMDAGDVIKATFSTTNKAAEVLVNRLTRIALSLYVLQEAAGAVQSAFGGLFKETIGREIKLRETILKTQTTLASTNKVFKNGKEITDPYQKIVSLTGAVRSNIDSIRERSIALAGVTSNEVIEVFGIVATQIGQVGGGLKEAEDLAVNFAAALGTFGIPLYQARQEIGSILRGDITMDSYLAKALGITNEDIAKAKTQAGGVVKFLEERLAASVAGQRIAAEGFSGVVSNIRDIGELVGQNFGAGLLDPLIGGLTKIFDFLFKIRNQVFDIARLAGTSIGTVASMAIGLTSGATGGFRQTTGGGGGSGSRGTVDQRSAPQLTSNVKAEDVLKNVEKAVKTVQLEIGKAISTVYLQIATLTERIASAFSAVSKGLANLAMGLLSLKLEQLKAAIGVIESVSPALLTASKAAGTFLAAWGEVLKLPLVQQFTQITTGMRLLEMSGVMPLIRTGVILHGVISNWGSIIKHVREQFDMLRAIIGGVIAWIGQLITQAGRAGLALLTAWQPAGKALQALRAEMLETVKQLEVIGNSAERAGNSIGGFGENIEKAGGGIKKFIIGMIRFNLIMFAISAALSIVTERFSAWKEAQDKVANEKRAMEAVRLLSTTYKDLGENATEAQKRAQAFQQSIVDQRYDEALSNLDKIKQKLEEIRDLGSDSKLDFGDYIRRTAQLFNPANIGAFNEKRPGELFADTVIRLQLEKEKKGKVELARWEKQVNKLTAEDKIKIEADNRTNLEKEIGELRRQQESEIFQLRQSLAQKEVEIFRAAGELRILQMEEANKQLIEGEEGASAAALEALNNYLSVRERGELDIEASKKQLVIEAANLERQISDYRLENEKKIAEIRKRAGENDQKMTDYRRQIEGQIAAGKGGGAATFGSTGNVRNGPGWVHGHFQTNSGTLNELITDVIPVLKALLDQGIPVELGNGSKVMTGKDDSYYRNLLSSAAKQHKHSGDGRSIDLFVPEGTKVPVPLSDVRGPKGNGGITGVLPGSGKSWVGHLAPGSRAGGAAAIPKPKLNNFDDLSAPAVEKYTAAIRSLTGAMERLRALQTALTKAKTAAAFREIAKAMFPSIGLEQYKDQIIEAEVQLQALASTSAEAYDPERLRLAVDLKSQELIKNKEIDEFNNKAKEQRKAGKITEEEFRKIQDDIATKKKKYLDDLKEEKRLKEQLLKLTREQQMKEGIKADIRNIPYDLRRAGVEATASMATAYAGDNPVARRQIEAEAKIAQKRIELEQQYGEDHAKVSEELAVYASHTRDAAQKLGELDQKVIAFQKTMEMINSAAQTLTDGMKGFAKTVLTGGDIQQAMTDMLENISGRFLDIALDAAFKPMEEQLITQLKNFLNIKDPKEELQKLNNMELARNTAALTTLATAVATASGLTPNGSSDTGTAPAAPTSAIPLKVVPFNGGDSSSAVTQAEGAYCDALDKATYTKSQETKQAEETGDKQFDFGKALSGATQAFGAIAMGVAGAQQMGKGGTYNTLMGLAGIFGALGSITGMFGTGGIFAAKPRASGGPIKANRPYLVGEIGPELFMPNSDGEILSNAKSRKLLSAAALAGKTQTFSTNVNSRRNANPAQVQFDFAYQSEVINNVEYVTSDQFRKGMADSAERGKNMAFAAMQNNVSTRRRLGL